VNDRYPTAAELKCMVSLSLIHGARGIGFYSYNHVTGKKGATFEHEQPAIWASLKEINAELAQIGPFLLEASPDDSVVLKEGGPEVEISVASRQGSHLILLANPSENARDVTLQFASAKNGLLKPVGQGSDVLIMDGLVKVKLPAKGTAAFKN
jgi:hypothetical protein